MTIGGILFSFLVLGGSMILEHGKPAAILNPGAMILVFGATIAATVAGSLRRDAVRLPRAFKRAVFSRHVIDAGSFAEHLLGLARDARTGGLNVFERELPEAQNDPFIRTGVELIATTSDPDRVRTVLEAEIEGMRTRHRICYRAFSDMAGYAPTIGILGTVVGLVHVLGSLSTPTTLGPEIATAFTATLWGVLSANLIWLPVSNKLRTLSEEEERYRELVIEGLLAVQEGLSGPQLRDRLEPFLAPGERELEQTAQQPQLGQERGVSPLRADLARKAEEAVPERGGGTERWLLTYSDMITLLLVLFVVLYALSSLNQQKYAEFINGVNKAFHGNIVPKQSGRVPGSGHGKKLPQTKAKPYASTTDIKRALVAALTKAGLIQDVKITTTSVALVEGFVAGKLFYAKDDAELSALGNRVVDVTATVIQRYPNPVIVEGYADNEPITGGPYINNWQLSAERAVYVVTRLNVNDHVNPTQLTTEGLGQYHPIVPNNSPANQAENRRVNIDIQGLPG